MKIKEIQALVAEDVKKVKLTAEEGEKILNELEERMQIVKEKIEVIKTEIKEALLLVPDKKWLKKVTIQNCSRELQERSQKIRSSDFPTIDWMLIGDLNEVKSIFYSLDEVIFNSYLERLKESVKQKEISRQVRNVLFFND